MQTTVPGASQMFKARQRGGATRLRGSPLFTHSLTHTHTPTHPHPDRERQHRNCFAALLLSRPAGECLQSPRLSLGARGSDGPCSHVGRTPTKAGIGTSDSGSLLGSRASSSDSIVLPRPFRKPSSLAAVSAAKVSVTGHHQTVFASLPARLLQDHRPAGHSPARRQAAPALSREKVKHSRLIHQSPAHQRPEGLGRPHGAQKPRRGRARGAHCHRPCPAAPRKFIDSLGAHLDEASVVFALVPGLSYQQPLPCLSCCRRGAVTARRCPAGESPYRCPVTGQLPHAAAAWRPR